MDNINYLNINVPNDTEICFIGDIHEHDEQFFKLIDELQPHQKRWIVSVGDVFDKGFGDEAAKKVSLYLQEASNKCFGYAVKGNHELKRNKARKNISADKIEEWEKWWKNRPLAITFHFKSGAKVTVVHAGITPKMGNSSLGSDIEVCYVRDVDDFGMIPLIWKGKDDKKELVKARNGGFSWHEKYDGRFGYVVSGHNAQKDGVAKFYNFSCNIDSGVYETGILTAQVFDKFGNLGKTITVSGVAKSPK